MKNVSYLLLILNSIFFVNLSHSQDLRFMTYNIRFANEADAPHTWQARKPLVLAQILDFKPDVIRFQEALHLQVTDLENELTDYRRIGVGRDDGATAGEYSPLFINNERFLISEHGFFWLSETPGQVSVGWDAALPRIATWATLADRFTNNQYLIINTHFDHIGKLARLNSIRQLVEFMKDPKFNGQITVLMGDLNTGPEEEPYQWLREQQLFSDPYFKAKHRKGPVGTFNAFKYEHQGDRMDYILLDPKLKVLSYEVLMESYNGILPSDHWPVMVVAVKE